MRSIACAALLTVGCGGGSGASDMMMQMASCAQMSMDETPIVGDSAMALAATTGPIKGWVADAYLAEVRGQMVTQTGKTTSGMGGGEWFVTYYSPSLNQEYLGVWASGLGHVSCQQINIATPPHMQPDPPKQKSGDVLATALAKVSAASLGMAMLPSKVNEVVYGQVSIGSRAPHDKAWFVDFAPATWRVIVDDETGAAIECDDNGTSCN